MKTQSAARATAPKTQHMTTNPNSKRRQQAAKAQLESTVRSYFEIFMENATLGEKWFLWDVLTNHECEHRSLHESSCELGIVSAFEQSISQHEKYFLCIEDEKVFNAVVKFIAEYRQCQKTGTFAAQPDGWRLWKNRKAAS